MTSSSPSYVLEGVLRASCLVPRGSCLGVRAWCLTLGAVLLVAGCKPSDGKDEYAEAQKALEAKNYEKAEELFAKSAELAPDNVDALVSLALSRIGRGMIKEAKAAAEKASALAPEDIDVRELLAQVAWYAGEFEAARELYLPLATDENISADVRSQAFAALGVIDMAMCGTDMQHDWLRDRARTEFLRAITIDRRNATARYQMALLYRDTFGYNEAALENFRAFLQLAPEADARVQRVQRDEMPNLTRIINEANAARPGAAGRDVNVCSQELKKAEAEWKKGAFTKARQYYSNANKADPLSYEAALGLAQAWEKFRNGKENALKYYQEACKNRTSATKTLIKTGDLAMELRKYAIATEAYSRAVAASAKDITAIDGLIRALRRSNRAKAAEVYQQYRDTIPVRKK